MQYKTLLDGTQLPVLGLGTWDVGGGSTPDYSQDAVLVDKLKQAIAMGYTHIDTAEMYAQGHTEELIGQAIRGLPREQLFITSKVWSTNLHYEGVHQALAGSLQRLGVETLDLYLIHWPNDNIPLAETFRALNELSASGKIKRVGVSNFDVPLLEEAISLSETPIVTNQVRYNLLSREPEENGVLAFLPTTGHPPDRLLPPQRRRPHPSHGDRYCPDPPGHAGTSRPQLADPPESGHHHPQIDE